MVSLQRKLIRGLYFALVFLLAVQVIVVSYQVFGRYVPFIPRLHWTEEISRGCFIWMVLLGAGLGVADRSHFALDLLTPRLHGKSCQAVRLGTAIVVLVIAVVMAISGWSLAVTGMGRRSLITGLPVVWVYGSVLIAGILMIVFALGWVMKTFTKPNSPEE
jgi:TRAP-type transport system small permease protein